MAFFLYHTTQTVTLQSHYKPSCSQVISLAQVQSVAVTHCGCTRPENRFDVHMEAAQRIRLEKIKNPHYTYKKNQKTDTKIHMLGSVYLIPISHHLNNKCCEERERPTQRPAPLDPSARRPAAEATACARCAAWPTTSLPATAATPPPPPRAERNATPGPASVKPVRPRRHLLPHHHYGGGGEL